MAVVGGSEVVSVPRTLEITVKFCPNKDVVAVMGGKDVVSVPNTLDVIVKFCPGMKSKP